MSIDALVFWLFVFAWLVVLGLIVFGAVLRAVREALRIVKRLLAMVNESPLPAQIAKAQDDAGRIGAALDRLPALERRARNAVELIRATPLVPPTIAAAFERARREIRALRSVGR